MHKIKKTLIVDKGINDAHIKFLASFIDIETTIDIEKVFKSSKSIHKKNTIVVFTDGKDITPAHKKYNEPVGSYTKLDKTRDKIEFGFLSKLGMYFGHDFPKLGFGRGSHLLTVHSGGKLIQHINNHDKAHDLHLVSKSGDLYDLKIEGKHHQMMYPYNLKDKLFDIVAWAKRYLSTTYLNGDNEEIILPETFLEPEIVYYRETNSLAIQGSPELMRQEDNRGLEIIKNTITNYLLNY